jgi:hypothetical protein
MAKRKDPFERLTEEWKEDIRGMLVADAEEISIPHWIAGIVTGKIKHPNSVELFHWDLETLTDDEIDKVRAWIDDHIESHS